MRLANLNDIASPCTFFTAPGDPVKILYDGVRVKDGGPITLVPKGKLNLREYINSYGCTTDMSYILARLKAGDDSVLFAESAVYGDTTLYPCNPAESLQLINRASAYFDNLPDDIRNRFDNNFINWIQSAGSEEWVANMAPSSRTDVSASAGVAVDASSSDT